MSEEIVPDEFETTKNRIERYAALRDDVIETVYVLMRAVSDLEAKLEEEKRNNETLRSELETSRKEIEVLREELTGKRTK
jgi:predicted  nucleic acid-binding Zn-ribbon protein